MLSDENAAFAAIMLSLDALVAGVVYLIQKHEEKSITDLKSYVPIPNDKSVGKYIHGKGHHSARVTFTGYVHPMEDESAAHVFKEVQVTELGQKKDSTRVGVWEDTRRELRKEMTGIPSEIRRTCDNSWTVKNVSVWSGNNEERIEIVEPERANGFRSLLKDMKRHTEHRTPGRGESGRYRVTGIETRESVLATGTTVTAVGSVNLLPDGKLRLSYQDGKGYLSNETVEDILLNLRSSVKFSRGIVRVTKWIAVGLVAYITLYLLKRYNCYERLMRVFGLRRPRPPPAPQNPTLVRADGDTADSTTCVVCLVYLRNVIFRDCGHMACCSNCALQLRDCPVCRQPIVGDPQPVFLS